MTQTTGPGSEATEPTGTTDRADAPAPTPLREIPGRLEEMADRPLAEQVEQFQAIHEQLRSALATVEHA